MSLVSRFLYHVFSRFTWGRKLPRISRQLCQVLTELTLLTLHKRTAAFASCILSYLIQDSELILEFHLSFMSNFAVFCFPRFNIEPTVPARIMRSFKLPRMKWFLQGSCKVLLGQGSPQFPSDFPLSSVRKCFFRKSLEASYF